MWKNKRSDGKCPPICIKQKQVRHKNTLKMIMNGAADGLGSNVHVHHGEISKRLFPPGARVS